MRNELEHNKAYLYTLGGLFAVVFLYLSITAVSLFNADEPRGLPEDPGALTETVAVVRVNL